MQTPIWKRTATRTTITSCFKQPTRALISLNLRLNPFPCDPPSVKFKIIFQSKKKKKKQPFVEGTGQNSICNLMIYLVIKALFVQHQGEGSTCIALGNRFKRPIAKLPSEARKVLYTDYLLHRKICLWNRTLFQLPRRTRILNVAMLLTGIWILFLTYFDVEESQISRVMGCEMGTYRHGFV